MATSDEDVKLLKTMISAAKKNPVNIGVCLGKKAENAVVVMDRKRNPDALGRAAKKSGETSKIAVGVLTVEGRDATFRCEGKPAAGVAKQLKLYFKSIDTPLNFVLLDESGNPIVDAEDEGVEGEEAEPGVDAEPETDTDDPARAAWETAWAAAETRVADAIRANPDLAGKLRAVRDFAMGKAEEGEYAGAHKSLQTLLGLIPAGKEVPGNTAPEPTSTPQSVVDTSALEKRLAELRERMTGLPPDALSRLAGPFKEAVGHVKVAAVDQATALADRIEAAINALSQRISGTAPQDQGGPDAVKLRQAVATMRTRAEAVGDEKVRAVLLDSLSRADTLIGQNETEQVMATLKKVQQLLANRTETPSEAPKGDPVVIWTEAAQLTETAFVSLRTTLGTQGNSELKRIADAALDGILSAEQAALAKAVDEWNRSPPEERAALARMVTAQTATLRNALGTNEIVKLVEGNPFGVTMDISAPLSRALDRIDAAVAG